MPIYGLPFLNKKTHDSIPWFSSPFWQNPAGEAPSVGLAKNRLLWYTSKTVPSPSPCWEHQGVFLQYFYYGDLVKFLEVNLTVCWGPCYDRVPLKSISQLVHIASDSCSFPTWTLVPKVVSTHESAPIAQDSLSALQTWRTQNLPGGFLLLMDPRRVVDFSVCSDFYLLVGQSGDF